jgi:hypothetical protein
MFRWLTLPLRRFAILRIPWEHKGYRHRNLWCQCAVMAVRCCYSWWSWWVWYFVSDDPHKVMTTHSCHVSFVFAGIVWMCTFKVLWSLLCKNHINMFRNLCSYLDRIAHKNHTEWVEEVGCDRLWQRWNNKSNSKEPT